MASVLTVTGFRFLKNVCVQSRMGVNSAIIPKRRQSTSVESEHIGGEQCQLSYLTGDKKGIAVVSMCRHEGKNSFSRQMASELAENLSHVRFDKNIRVIILRSEVPGIFSAGADLKERLKMAEGEVARFVSMGRGNISDLSHLPQPSIAAIDGAALGGGLEIALACDMRVAADSAKIGLTETRLGIMPGGGGTQRLARVVGPALAKELIFTARILDGQEAARLGVVNHCVPQNDTGDASYYRALDLAMEILPRGPVAIKMAKIALSRGIEVDLESGLRFEEACYAQVIPTKDRIEGLLAFKEKRPPIYKGE